MNNGRKEETNEQTAGARVTPKSSGDDAGPALQGPGSHRRERLEEWTEEEDLKPWTVPGR